MRIKNLNINLAIFVTLAFIFRLLFVHIGLATNNTPQTLKHETERSAGLLEKKQATEINTVTSIKDYSVVEACEEDSDNEEDQVKTTSSVILSVLFSVLDHVPFVSGSTITFDSIKCNLFPKKYLALSILRI
jgi:hypothetical protein